MKERYPSALTKITGKNKITSQLAFTYSNSAGETEQCVKSVQS